MKSLQAAGRTGEANEQMQKARQVSQELHGGVDTHFAAYEASFYGGYFLLRWAEECGLSSTDDLVFNRAREYIVYARALLFQGKAQESLALIARLLPIVETAEDVAGLDMGQPEKLVYLTQTTLSIDDTADVITALRKKYPQIIAPPLSDICFATTNRQAAVKELAKASDLVLVLGSKTSSNSTRLMETARAEGTEAYLIDDVSEIESSWLEGREIVGISAGASAPEHVVEEVVQHLAQSGAIVEDFIVKPENMHLAEPLELMRLKKGV